MFPAGLVSRLHPDSRIRDLQWKKSFVTKAVEYHRLIVPVKFEALNSMKFYRIAKWRKKLGVKVNVEQALLPSELCKSRGKHFVIRFGEPVDPSRLVSEGLSPSRIAETIRASLY